MPRLSSRHALIIPALIAFTGCTFDAADDAADQQAAQTSDTQTPDPGYETYSDDNLADTMASNDAGRPTRSDGSDGSEGTNGERSGADANSGADTDVADADADAERPTMRLQVVLDREGFGPGVIDGKMGMSTKNALIGFQRARDLEETGTFDDQTGKALQKYDAVPATRMVTIPERWGELDYIEIPEKNSEIADLERMAYTSLDEKLAERFHTTIEVLKELNPNSGSNGTGADNDDTQKNQGDAREDGSGAQNYFRAGQEIRVPNIGADRIAPDAVTDISWQRTLASLGVGTEQPEVDRVVVSKSAKTLYAYSGDELVSVFTVSSGSSQFPLPLGEWDMVGVAYNPPYSYNPEVLGKQEEDAEEFTFPPGPNSPVGVVWIDLSKEHYGIHGTPEPETIGRAQSSGCVRLTNWDAARLAQMVDQQTRIIFEA